MLLKFKSTNSIIEYHFYFFNSAHYVFNDVEIIKNIPFLYF